MKNESVPGLSVSHDKWKVHRVSMRLLKKVFLSNKKAPGRIRTGDLRITNAALYQLSYRSLYQMFSDTYVIILKTEKICK